MSASGSHRYTLPSCFICVSLCPLAPPYLPCQAYPSARVCMCVCVRVGSMCRLCVVYPPTIRHKPYHCLSLHSHSLSSEDEAFRPRTISPSPAPSPSPSPSTCMSPNQRQWIVFAACGPQQSLPTSPQVPADLFTSCLTTPIKTALMWFIQVCRGVNDDLMAV